MPGVSPVAEYSTLTGSLPSGPSTVTTTSPAPHLLASISNVAGFPGNSPTPETPGPRAIAWRDQVVLVMEVKLGGASSFLYYATVVLYWPYVTSHCSDVVT